MTPKRPPYFQIQARLAACTDIGLAAKLVYSVLASAARRQGVTRIGTRLIGRLAGIDKTTVLRAARELERTGWLSIEDGHRGQRRSYTIDTSGRKMQPLEEPKCPRAATSSQESSVRAARSQVYPARTT